MSTDESVTVWIEADISAFTAAMQKVVAQFVAAGAESRTATQALADLMIHYGRSEASDRRRSSMHAAYRAKTRRRNRR